MILFGEKDQKQWHGQIFENLLVYYLFFLNKKLGKHNVLVLFLASVQYRPTYMYIKVW